MNACCRRRYAANNVVVSVAGNSDWVLFVRLITRSARGGTLIRWGGTTSPSGPARGFHVLTRKKVGKSTRCSCAAARRRGRRMRYAADTLAMAVGRRLRQPAALVARRPGARGLGGLQLRGARRCWDRLHLAERASRRASRRHRSHLGDPHGGAERRHQRHESSSLRSRILSLLTSALANA